MADMNHKNNITVNNSQIMVCVVWACDSSLASYLGTSAWHETKKGSKHLADLGVAPLETTSLCKICFQLIKDSPVRRDMFPQALFTGKVSKCVASTSNLAWLMLVLPPMGWSTACSWSCKHRSAHGHFYTCVTPECGTVTFINLRSDGTGVACSFITFGISSWSHQYTSVHFIIL